MQHKLSVTKDVREEVRPYITYYQVNIGNETSSSSEETSREETPIKKDKSSKLDSSSTVVDIDESYDISGSKSINQTKNIGKYGDNPAIHFAVDGASFDIVKKYYPEDADKLRVKGTVFARMSPDQKESLIGR